MKVTRQTRARTKNDLAPTNIKEEIDKKNTNEETDKPKRRGKKATEKKG